ncbi:MAG: putative lipase, partial [Gemmatimonadota bacterium]|nr:putative lipase [Gemmatimonadota bacterium]
GRSPLSMAPLAWALEREGYRVVNWGYSSFSHTIPELGARLAGEVQRHENNGERRVHFVGHSLGNVVVRWVLAHDPPEDPGRVVMLAPPNGGSRSADRYARWLGWLLPPLRELQTSEGSTARTLGLGEAVEVGVIAGLYDGKVSVAETHLDGERAHIVVPSAHSFIMVRSDVIRLTVRFLREARFTE